MSSPEANFYFLIFTRQALESQRQSLRFIGRLLRVLAADFSKCFPISVCSLQQVFNTLQVLLHLERAHFNTMPSPNVFLAYSDCIQMIKLKKRSIQCSIHG